MRPVWSSAVWSSESWPRVIGHRGLAAHAPENTIAGFRRAAAAGFGMVEFDAKLSAEGAIILMHDDDLDRTTNGKGKVAAQSLAALKKLDAGAWFAPAFVGEPIPTLGESLAALASLGLDFNLEIKPCPGREIETARKVMTELRLRNLGGMGKEGAGLPIISSFAAASLKAAKEMAPEFPIGLLLEDRPADWRDRASALSAFSIHIGDETADPDWIAAMKKAGYRVLVYTVNDPARARFLFAAGVDGIFTDRADLAALTGPPLAGRL